MAETDVGQRPEHDNLLLVQSSEAVKRRADPSTSIIPVDNECKY